ATLASVRDPDDARGRSRRRAARRVEIRARSRAVNAAAGRADAPGGYCAPHGPRAATARAPWLPVRRMTGVAVCGSFRKFFPNVSQLPHPARLPLTHPGAAPKEKRARERAK